MGLRSEALNGAGVHDFESGSPIEDTFTGKVAMIYFPVDTTITGIYEKEGGANLLENFSNTGLFKANETIAPKEGDAWKVITGSSGRINYVNG